MEDFKDIKNVQIEITGDTATLRNVNVKMLSSMLTQASLQCYADKQKYKWDSIADPENDRKKYFIEYVDAQHRKVNLFSKMLNFAWMGDKGLKSTSEFKEASEKSLREALSRWPKEDVLTMPILTHHEPDRTFGLVDQNARSLCKISATMSVLFKSMSHEGNLHQMYAVEDCITQMEALVTQMKADINGLAQRSKE